jgi:mono/diheme cytochrome c family protein
MKTIFLSLASMAFAAALGTAPALAAQAAPQGDAAHGRAEFDRVGCWECHGYRGQGGREGPRIADPVPLAWPAFLAWVRTTSGPMPPFTEKVLAQQSLVDIYAYLQSVPKAPNYKSVPLLSDMTSTASAQ